MAEGESLRSKVEGGRKERRQITEDGGQKTEDRGRERVSEEGKV